MAAESSSSPCERPAGFDRIYEGPPLPPAYAAAMLAPYIGKTIWAKDSGGRTRCGQLRRVPDVKDDVRDAPPVEFEDERPLYLREIVCLAVYKPPFSPRERR